MAGLTYPPAAPSATGGEVIAIHRLLKDPTRLAKALKRLSNQRYIADVLLTGRYSAQGGAIAYETGEPIGAGEKTRVVDPGGEYPLVVIGNGQVSMAYPSNRGQDTLVTDKAISRMNIDPVRRALLRLVQQNVIDVDGAAMAVITSALTNTKAASANWQTSATAAQILQDVLTADAQVRAQNNGFETDTVVLDDMTWAVVFAKFAAAGMLPRDSDQNPILTGSFPVVAGKRFLRSPNAPASTAVLVDGGNLGGMADEKDNAPGYASAPADSEGPAVEVKSIRQDENDRYRLRARRSTVAVVLEPLAGVKIQGVS
ncbi:hypothetical protein PZ938_03100 [Luteipulveratus sp. YIM 133132]|uniref:phage major capsid protein n=1 Tax=Luteipulveratus flavus TaxID=3031728 RepID=UPI0023B15088|nr:hypothetical protein [Luteipulveratus sp. YIM 133132]MDE9364580.1 hypothetical protein [Luteipulveratus sp. YIM 133132]